MEKLKKLKLTSLIENELVKQKMDLLLGGYGCSCQCYPDGSLSNDANSYSYYVNGGLPGQCMCSCVCYGAYHDLSHSSGNG